MNPLHPKTPPSPRPRRGVIAMILAAAAASGGLALRARADAGSSIAYQNPFLYPVGDEWSDGRESTAPTGEQFLGPFGNQGLKLELGDLPEHEYMVIAFDLYTIGDWPGDFGPDGKPSTITVVVDGVKTLMTASLASDNGDEMRTQSYPDDVGKRTHVPEWGAFLIDTLGYKDAGSARGADATYRVILSMRHSGKNAVIEFMVNGVPEGMGSWGLDNVTVEVSSGQLFPPLSVMGPTSLEAYYNEWYGARNMGTNPLRPFGVPQGPPITDDDPPPDDPPDDPPTEVPGPATGVAIVTVGAGWLGRRRRR